jgi:hypothetical protein
MLSTLVLTFAVLATGCSTTQEVTLTKGSFSKQIKSVVITPEENNSAEMTSNLENALLSLGVTVKPAVSVGVRKATDADAVVSYVDVWRWDIVMYLRELSLKVYDAETGDLLALGSWKNSPLHGFQDAKVVVKGLVDDVLLKIKSQGK